MSRLPYSGPFAAQKVPRTLFSGSTSQKKALSFLEGLGPGCTRGFGGARGFADPFFAPAARSGNMRARGIDVKRNHTLARGSHVNLVVGSQSTALLDHRYLAGAGAEGRMAWQAGEVGVREGPILARARAQPLERQ